MTAHLCHVGFGAHTSISLDFPLLSLAGFRAGLPLALLAGSFDFQGSSRHSCLSLGLGTCCGAHRTKQASPPRTHLTQRTPDRRSLLLSADGLDRCGTHFLQTYVGWKEMNQRRNKGNRRASLRCFRLNGQLQPTTVCLSQHLDLDIK